MDRNQVIARIEDWERRLDAFYERIDQWYEKLPPHSNQQLFKGSILQRDESPLKDFGIQPRMLPTRAIVYGENRVSFVPSVLWIVGANGRMNVTTNLHRFVLVDMGGAND